MKTVTLEEAQRMLRENSLLKEKEEVSILDCAGRILAEDIFARIDQPPFRRSSMDGYAVRSIDTKGASPERPVQLKIVDRVYAGTNEEKHVLEKEAVRIMTGGMLPEGADCVVRQEDTDYGEEFVSIYREMCPGDYFCPIGAEIGKGTRIALKDSIVDANVIAAAVAAGLFELPVRKKVRAAVLTTGDELCEIGKTREKGQIYPSNMAYLTTRLKQLGCEVTMMCQPRDRLDTIAEAIREGLQKADLVITTGGVSVGEKDFLERAVVQIGAKILFHGLAVNPGRPSMASVYEKKPIISLTGTSFSAEIVFELLVRSVISAMQGTDQLEWKCASAIVQEDIQCSKKRSRKFIRGYFADGRVWPTNKQGKAKNLNGIGMNCLLDIPEEKEWIDSGETVKVILL